MRYLPAVCATLVLCVFCCVAGAQSVEDAAAVISKQLDEENPQGAIMALRATGDKDLLPVFEALCRSVQKNRRIVATASIVDLLEKDAAPVLAERFEKDTLTVIRAQALAALMTYNAATADQLGAAIKSGDENLQTLGARGLVKLGKGDLAKETLLRLAESKDKATAGMCRLTLLGMGQNDQHKAVEEIFADEKTPEEVLSLLLEQIYEEKITAAADIARSATASQSRQVQVLGYKALTVASPQGPAEVAAAIAKSTQTVTQVQLLKLLANCPGSAKHIEGLKTRTDTVGIMARFELSRATGGADAAAACQAALKLGHPVVIAYVLESFRKDVVANGTAADWYTAAMLELIRGVDAGASQMRGEHMQAALATTALADMGTPAALAGLKDLLAQRYSAVVRSVGAGFLRTNNKQAAELMKPLLTSQYDELATDAALVLGRLGDKDALPVLGKVYANPGAQGPPMAVMAAWYYIKASGKGPDAAKTIAEKVK